MDRLGESYRDVAATIGAAFLGEALAAVDRPAIGLVVTANVVAVLVTPAASAPKTPVVTPVSH